MALSAGAAPVAQFAADFSVEIVSGDFLVGETFSEQLVYDDAFITGAEMELIDSSSGLISLDFTYVGAD